MSDRRGEKAGWLLGWSGGFVWVFILAVILLVQGQAVRGGTGLVLIMVAALAILGSAPWRHPQRPYWQLMLPVYAVFFLALGWAIRSYGGMAGLGLSGWSVFLLLPLLIPFVTMGARSWTSGNDK